MTEVRYGTRFMLFWKPTSKNECASAIVYRGQLAEDTLDRLLADADNDRYMGVKALTINM